MTESGYFNATFTDTNGTIDAQVYVHLTVIPAPVSDQPEKGSSCSSSLSIAPLTAILTIGGALLVSKKRRK